ncbi:MAG: hypothetical protein AVDCRST_MAG79-1834, partial [uncultured Thermoleophilia bacterium]
CATRSCTRTCTCCGRVSPRSCTPSPGSRARWRASRTTRRRRSCGGSPTRRRVTRRRCSGTSPGSTPSSASVCSRPA